MLMMSKIKALSKGIALAALACCGVGGAQAQMGPQAPWAPENAKFVRLASGVPGVLFSPTTISPRNQIAFFVMHANGDYTAFPACTELAKRGYQVLCANNSTSKDGLFDDGALDRILLEAKAGIAWLRAQPGVKKVVLFGHSGGNTVMTAYQMVAEGGVKSCQGEEKIHKCPDNLAGLPVADGIVMADSNWGQSAMTLFSVDPAVKGLSKGTDLDPKLDMFNPANGFKATGSTYSPEFIKKFLAAASARNMAILKAAQTRMAAIKAGKGDFTDDEIFVVAGSSYIGFNNKLYSQDTRLLEHSKAPWPLIRADGSVVTQVIHSVRPPMSKENLSPSFMRGALRTTVDNYLSSYATRTTPEFSYGETSEIKGVDWQSNYANPVGNVEKITAPMLALGMTGGWEGLAAETIYEHAASKDKALAFVEGATHVYTPCRPCEKTPGQFGDTVKNLFDYVDAWTSKPGRFLN
jgi:hypothetical protein